MRRLAAIIAVAAAMLVAAAPAGAGAEPGGIGGRMFDVSCYGPCVPDQESRPYYGHNVNVIIRTLPERELVAILVPRKSYFGPLAVAPGLYRVRARFPRDEYCWQGSRRRVKVDPGEIAHVRLHVQNACIV